MMKCTGRAPAVIVHVLNGLNFGGVEALCLQLIKHSSPRIRHVLVNLDPSHADMKEVFATACPELSFLEVPYVRRQRTSFVLRMARDLKAVAADGVLVYAFGLHVLVALSARIAGIDRTVVHAGNPPPLDRTQRRLWMAIAGASLLLRVPIKSCSAMVDRELRALVGVLPAGSEPVPNGVDIAAIESAASVVRAKRDSDGPRIVGMIARLNAIKDHDTLLRAFAFVREEMSECELWLVGDGELRPVLTALARELGIASAVRFLGERSDAHSMLGAMDVFAFSTTRHEGFGIALAEAMAARIPIVATDVEACREVLANGDAARLVRPREARDFAAAILELLRQPDLAHAMAHRAYARAKADFDIKDCAARYYASLTSQEARRDD